MRSKIPCAVPTFTQIDGIQDHAFDWIKSDRAIIRRRQGIRDLRPRLEDSRSFTSQSSPSIQPRALVSAIPSLSKPTLHRQRSDNSLRSNKPRNFSRPIPSPAYAPSTPSPLKLHHNRGEVDTPSDYGSEAIISDTESIRERLILHKHKDSGVDIPKSLTPISVTNIAQQSIALRVETETSASVLSGIIDTYRNRDELAPSPTRSSSRTRSTQAPAAIAFHRHEDTCVCQHCRQTRSRRRKKTMRLTKQLEQCKASMLAVRDPSDPHNLERGEIYGLWLKLARLHVSYDNLISIPVVNLAEEEALFLAYMEVFNILTRLISLEKARWPEIEHTATKLSAMQNASDTLLITIKHS